MTSARSVVASAVALGFASMLTTPPAALAAPLPALAAPASCREPGHHAAQASAELLRINRLELGAIAAKAPRFKPSPPAASPSPSSSPQENQAGFAPAARAPSAADPGVRADDRAGRAVGGFGLGDARSVLIADGPVKSAAAARVLNGRLAGSAAHNDLLVQQAPPTNTKPSEQRIGAKRFGLVRAGGGKLTVHAGWAEGMGCGALAGEASTSAASLTRVTVAGGGNQSLVRVAQKISSTTSTALRHRAGESESVATATFQGGKLNLADGDVHIRVLRAATLEVSMAESGRGEVRYVPALVEVTGRDGKITRLDTPGDHSEITVGEEIRALESAPALIAAADALPVPRVPGLPALGELETTRVPAGSPAAAPPGAFAGTRVRVSLGDVRQVARGRAIAARATAVKVSLIRTSPEGRTSQRARISPDRRTSPSKRSSPSGRTKDGYGQSDVVADLGIGLLEGGAVAPRSGAPDASPADTDTGGGEGVAVAGLPITGPGVAPVLLTGAGLLAGGVLVVLLGVRRRRS